MCPSVDPFEGTIHHTVVEEEDKGEQFNTHSPKDNDGGMPPHRPSLSNTLRLCLGVGGTAWIVITLFLVMRFAEHLEISQHQLFSSLATPTQAPRRLPFRIFIQEAALPAAVQVSLSQATTSVIDCHQPYRTLPLLLDEPPVLSDPYLPYIHDYFVSPDGSKVHFVAQNRRRCYTGRNRKDDMAYWEPQIALLQPVSVKQVVTHNSTTTSPYYLLTDPEHADFTETRFRCRFHLGRHPKSFSTFSVYPFNYEYINWRKRARKPMFVKEGPDVEIFDYATLLFACPIPTALQNRVWSDPNFVFYVDLAPIRTPARYEEGYLLTPDQVGPHEYATLHRFNATEQYRDRAKLPTFDQVGRLENLPVCLGQPSASNKASDQAPKHQLVACAWVAASYARRGGRSSVADAPERLREWLAFHRMVGFNHVYIYDNTHVDNQDSIDDDALPLKKVSDLFPGFVTWIRWPAKVCNNNFVGGRNPGERSSQYAAEASCRERFGSSTQWMTFLDIDEYLIPVQNDTWGPMLEAKGKNHPVLGLRESRTHPRFERMEEVSNAAICQRSADGDKQSRESTPSCLVKRRNETFLSLYNCDTVKPPRPRVYFRNMKQIYRPDFVLSHFVHYSAVTRKIAEYYKDKADPSTFSRVPSRDEK